MTHSSTHHGVSRGRSIIVAALIASAAVMLSACAPAANPDGVKPSGSASSSPESNLTGELTIFAAASLTASFGELAANFEAQNPGVTVNPISFDGSSTLATQINEGAPADVFASADEANMAKVKDMIDGTGTGTATGTIFVTNVLQIAVQPGNPKKITGLADLAKAGISTVLCAPAVPCGTASRKLLDLGNVVVSPVSEEQNVKAVLTKVQLGEADAGLVYKTDVTAAAGAVDGVDIKGADRAVNSYPIAALKGSKNADIAQAFVNYVLSPAGQSILEKYGFGKP